MQTRNHYLNHLIDPSFQGVNRLFVLSFENDAHRKTYKRYFLPTVEIKDYNVMIDGKNFFDQPEKNDLITHEKIGKIETGQGDYYTTGCLLDCNYFKNYYKITAKGTQQINFTANLDRAGNTSMFFIIKEAKETILDFSQGTVKVF